MVRVVVVVRVLVVRVVVVEKEVVVVGVVVVGVLMRLSQSCVTALYKSCCPKYLFSIVSMPKKQLLSSMSKLQPPWHSMDAM